MFERKNQNILSEHYTKLIDYQSIGVAPFLISKTITLRRAGHDLDEVGKPSINGPVDAETFAPNLSKQTERPSVL